MLLLVLQHELVQHGVHAVRGRAREHALADRREVLARAGGVQQLDLAAHGARRLERVVGRGEVGAQQRLAGVAMHEPEVLVGGDVGEIPDERAHQRVDLALEVAIADRGGEHERALTRLLECSEQVFTHV